MKEDGISKLYTKIMQVLGYIGNTIYYIMVTFSVVILLGFGMDKLSGGEGNIFGYKPAIIKTGSMLPTIQEYALIIGESVEGIGDVKEEDIVTYSIHEYGEDKLVTHRAVEIDEENNRIQTKGDANNTVDFFGDSEYLPIDQVVYKVVHVNNKISPYVSRVVHRPVTLVYVFMIVAGLGVMKRVVDGELYKEEYEIKIKTKKGEL